MVAFAALVILVVGGFFIVRNTFNPSYQTVAVERGELVKEVLASGKIEAKQAVDIAFDTQGTVSGVTADVGDEVEAGDVLVNLDDSTLRAELAQAAADLKRSRADTGTTGVNLERVREKQDTLVENAYRTLLSEGLVAEPSITSTTADAPQISGRFTGPEGTYKVLFGYGDQTNNKQVSVFGIETVRNVEISKTGPTPLGSHGLYFTLSDPLVSYMNTTWYVTIPNTQSDSYLDNYNAYQDAVKERDRAIDEAETKLASVTGGSSIATAEQASASASVARVQAELAKRVLTAPFDGIITKQEAEVGQHVGAGEEIVSLMPKNDLQITLNVSENNIAGVQLGQEVRIEMDAFPDREWQGVVTKIDPAETVIGGAVYYNTTVIFDPEDAPVRSGMTVDAKIATQKLDSALHVPASAIVNKGGQFLVRSLSDGVVEEVTVEIGLEDAEGNVEIRSGLIGGEQIVIFP